MSNTYAAGTRVRVKIANNWINDENNYAEGIVTGEVGAGYRVRLDDGQTLSTIPGQMRRI